MTNATQIIILGIFIFFLIVAVFVFAVFNGGAGNSNAAPVEIWGTLPESLLPHIVEAINTANVKNPIKIHYTEISADGFEDTLTKALADGTGPDVVLMPENLLFANKKRLAVIGYNAYPERTFKDSFVSASEVLFSDKGTYGLPFLLDPMVMYWNRDILSSAGISQPPRTWEQALAMVPKITQVNDDKTIKRSTIGLGDYANINHGKEILASLMLQAGSRMVAWDSIDAAKNLLAVSRTGTNNPMDDALGFFTEFSDPEKPMYSWTRALPDSIDYFSSGDLALYFGPSSDESRIRAKNPNLNFDVATLPQPASASTKSTFANVWSFSVLASSRNQAAALNVIATLTSAFADKMASDATGLAPVRRDLLSVPPAAADQSVFFSSALFAQSWLDPSPRETNAIFGSAVEAIVAGQLIVPDASKVLGKQVQEIIDRP